MLHQTCHLLTDFATTVELVLQMKLLVVRQHQTYQNLVITTIAVVVQLALADGINPR